MTGLAALAADDWWWTLPTDRRVQIHGWITQRGHLPEQVEGQEALLPVPAAPGIRDGAAARVAMSICPPISAAKPGPLRDPATGRFISREVAQR